MVTCIDAEYFHGFGKYSIWLMLNIFTDLEISTEIGNLTNLQHLDFYNAKVVVTIPKEIFLLPFLSYLDMSSNNLIGAVPPLRSVRADVPVHVDVGL